MAIELRDREELSKVISYNVLYASEAAALLGVSKASFSNMVARGNFKAIKEGVGVNLYLRSEILRYKDAKDYMKKVRSGSLPVGDNPPKKYPLLLDAPNRVFDNTTSESTDATMPLLVEEEEN